MWLSAARHRAYLYVWFVYPVRLHWRKLILSFVSSYQLKKASGLGIGACAHFSTQSRDPLGLDLYRPSACCHSLCEFLCTPVLLFFLGVLHSQWILQSFYFLFHTLAWALSRRDLMETSHLVLSFPRSLTLYTMSSCGSLCLLPSTVGGSVCDDG